MLDESITLLNQYENLDERCQAFQEELKNINKYLRAVAPTHVVKPCITSCSLLIVDGLRSFVPAMDSKHRLNCSVINAPLNVIDEVMPTLQAQMGIEEANITDLGMARDDNEENVIFTDQDPGFGYAIPTHVDSLRSSRDEEVAEFKNILKRPLKLSAYRWSIGGDLFADINPWEDFLSHPKIVNRINNFNLFRGTMKVKFTLNGTGFHYGRAIASYMPLHNFDRMSNFDPADRNTLTQFSQLPHVFLNPTTSQGGELTLPFVYHKDYLHVPSAEWSDMGIVLVRTLNQLKHANGGTDQVTMTVFAWFEDFELSTVTSRNTVALTAQMGIEAEVDQANKTGTVSGPATKLAMAAGMLTSIPYIGPYMGAASKGLSISAAIAKLFGYSRPTVTKAPEPYKPEPIGSLATATTPDRSAKLTFDDKQELTIDPAISGMASRSDPMSILSIAKHESYLDTFTWSVGAGPEDFLWNARVQPTQWRITGPDSAADSLYYFTSTAMASLPFDKWTGTLNFRFQAVASAHHRGKLALVYDPNFIVESAQDGQYLVTSRKVLDLAASPDCTISIANGQTTTWLKHFDPAINATDTLYGTTEFANAEKHKANGVIGAYVINELATSNSTVNNDIQINVYISAGDDFQVAQPSGDYLKYFEGAELGYQLGDEQFLPDSSPNITFQMGEEVSDSQEDTAGVEAVNNDKPVMTESTSLQRSYLPAEMYEINFGEAIPSFRGMIKRFNKSEKATLNKGVTIPGTLSRYSMRRHPFPRVRHFSPTNTGMYAVSGGTYDFVNMTLLNFVTLGFAGSRGAVRWKFHPYMVRPHTLTSLVTRRQNIEEDLLCTDGRPTLPANGLSVTAIARGGVYAPPLTEYNQVPLATDGSALTVGQVNPMLEFEVPYYSQFRFSPGKRIDYINFNEVDYPDDNVIEVDFTGDFADRTDTVEYLDVYVAAGDDYQVYFYTGLPPLKFRFNSP